MERHAVTARHLRATVWIQNHRWLVGHRFESDLVENKMKSCSVDQVLKMKIRNLEMERGVSIIGCARAQIW